MVAPIVIGLGSGRSGTASLTELLNRQPGGFCFHELNPSCSVFSGNPQPALNTVAEFRHLLAGGERQRLTVDYARPASVQSYQRLQSVEALNFIGDIAYYYLNYVEELQRAAPECRFVCLKRDRQETVASWLKKSAIGRWPSLYVADRIKAFLTRTPFHQAYNYWQEHDGSVYRPDPMWDSCFPKIEAASREEAIGLYWDYYYLEADRLAQLYGEVFRVFDVSCLSTAEGQQDILEFIGVPAASMVVGREAHSHRSNPFSVAAG